MSDWLEKPIEYDALLENIWDKSGLTTLVEKIFNKPLDRIEEVAVEAIDSYKNSKTVLTLWIATALSMVIGALGMVIMIVIKAILFNGSFQIELTTAFYMWAICTMLTIGIIFIPTRWLFTKKHKWEEKLQTMQLPK